LIVGGILSFIYGGSNFFIEQTWLYIFYSLIPIGILIILRILKYVIKTPVNMFEELGGFEQINVHFDLSKLEGFPGQKHITLLIYNETDKKIKDCVVTILNAINTSSHFSPIPDFIDKNDKDRKLIWIESNSDTMDVLGKKHAQASIAICNRNPNDSFWLATNPQGVGNNKSYKYKATKGIYLITLEISGIFLWQRFRKEKVVEINFKGDLEIDGSLKQDETSNT
jgi:hypothetical protein